MKKPADLAGFFVDLSEYAHVREQVAHYALVGPELPANVASPRERWLLDDPAVSFSVVIRLENGARV